MGVSASSEVFNVAHDGTVNAAGPVIGAAGSGIPIAFATVKSDGTWVSGTSNCTTIWNSSNSWYEITISGVNYTGWGFSAIATLFGYPGYPATISTDAANNKLLVYIHDAGGNQRQAHFSVAVFQYRTPLKAQHTEAPQPGESVATPSGLPGH